MKLRATMTSAWALLTGLAGGWLILSPWALAEQPAGQAWAPATQTAVFTGLGLVVLAVIGLVAVTQACIPLLRRGPGRIVNIGSISGRSALPGSGPYDSTKFAVEAITDSLRLEVHRWGIAVSVIEAGAMATPIYDKCLRGVDELSRQVPPERYALYRGLMETIREETGAEARRAAPVSKVVKAVVRALTARRPRARYLVGRDVWLWLLLNGLPTRWRDWLILSRVRD